MADEEKQVEQEEAVDTPTTQPAAVTAGEATFTQADLDAKIKERLARESRKLDKLKAETAEKYGDYDDLKAAAEKLAAIEDANKTETEKQLERMAKLDARAKELESQNARLAQERQEALLRSAVVSEATRLDFQDPLDAYRMLDMAQIEINEQGQADNLAETLQALAEAKPYLLREQQSGARLPATNPGRGHEVGETDAQRRSRLMGIGDSPLGRTQGGGLILPQQ